jgi:hypothetical protein
VDPMTAAMLAQSAPSIAQALGPALAAAFTDGPVSSASDAQVNGSQHGDGWTVATGGATARGGTVTSSESQQATRTTDQSTTRAQPPIGYLGGYDYGAYGASQSGGASIALDTTTMIIVGIVIVAALMPSRGRR